MFKYGFILLCINFLAFSILKSQIADLPYTMFGAGQIENSGFGVNEGLGGTGLAFESKNTLNNMNPASYSGIDSLSFLFEFGAFIKLTKFLTNIETQSKFDGNICYLAMGLRFTNRWAGSLGLVPFSSVGYEIHSTDNIEGELTSFKKTYTGSGGINQLYFGNSFKIFENLSAGFNVSFIFGTITQSETAENISSDFTGYTLENINYVHSFYLDYGLQYTINRDNWKYTLGLIYGNRKSLPSSREVYFNYLGDSAITLESESGEFQIPSKFGIGLALVKVNSLRAGFDYETKNWSVIDFENPLFKTRKSERYSMGLEFKPMKSSTNKRLQNLYYRIGANYSKSYLEIDGIPINSKAMTVGLGIPLKIERSVINLSCEFGQNGATSNGMIRENYWLIHFNFTLHEKWFQKVKFE